jgi:hypothetical protein
MATVHHLKEEEKEYMNRTKCKAETKQPATTTRKEYQYQRIR